MTRKETQGVVGDDLRAMNQGDSFSIGYQTLILAGWISQASLRALLQITLTNKGESAEIISQRVQDDLWFLVCPFQNRSCLKIIF